MNTGAFESRRIYAAACAHLAPSGASHSGSFEKVVGALSAPLFLCRNALLACGAVVALAVIATLYALNELRLRRRLGAFYEGPAED